LPRHLSHACSASFGVGQGGGGDTLARGDGQHGAIRACDAPARWSACHENSVGERNRAAGAVIVGGTNFTRAPGLSGSEREQHQALCQKTLDHRSCSLDLKVIAPLESVYRLSEIEGAHRCAAVQYLLHLSGGGLGSKKRDERRGVDQGGHRRLSRRHWRSRSWTSSSSSRSKRLASSEPSAPICVANAPTAAATGSSGAGRSTTWSPRSSARTVRVRHRLRTAAGTDTWPPLDITSRFAMAVTISHETRILGARADRRSDGARAPDRASSAAVTCRFPTRSATFRPRARYNGMTRPVLLRQDGARRAIP
jgi:hypothetical protein